ncbi:four-carbon acid sugar kinase family protein [Pseudactinotalea suaedae]
MWADDLTGAAEVADLLAARTGRPVTLALGPEATATTATGQIVVRDFDLRHSSDAVARSVLAQELARTAAADRVFLKLDSQLHGPVAGCLAAMLDGGRATLLSAANPAMGRVTNEGIHRVVGPDGVTATRLADLLAGVPHRVVDGRSLTTAGDAPEILAADATDQSDLDALASAAVEHGLDLAGAAALMAALLGSTDSVPSPAPRAGGRLVAVVGSTEPAAHAQVAAAASHRTVSVVAVAPDDVRNAVTTANEARRQGRDVVLARGPGPAGLGALAEAAAAVIGGCDPEQTMVVLTGGHTARLVLDRLGVRSLEAVPDQAGAMVRLRAPSGLTVFTKPGSYGGPDAVLALLDTRRPAPDEEYR